jgi:hypothetical protein
MKCPECDFEFKKDWDGKVPAHRGSNGARTCRGSFKPVSAPDKLVPMTKTCSDVMRDLGSI